MIYEIFNYEGDIVFDLDIKKLNDFDEWGREYNVYNEDGIVYVEYTKKKKEKRKIINYVLELRLLIFNMIYYKIG